MTSLPFSRLEVTSGFVYFTPAKPFAPQLDIRGESTRNHPAPFPLELALRLVRMYSFVGDMVLDPFAGTGTTMLAALETGRNSVGFEIDPGFFAFAKNRIGKSAMSLDRKADFKAVRSS